MKKLVLFSAALLLCVGCAHSGAVRSSGSTPGATTDPARSPAHCGGDVRDKYGDEIVRPPHTRVWQPAKRNMRCGPDQPWGLGLSEQCPNGQNSPNGMSCEGYQPGTTCYVPNNVQNWEFQCDATTGNTPSRWNRQFSIFVCPP